MVLLTMTPAIVAAVQACYQLHELRDELDTACEPSMSDPAIGKPITHTQLIAISKVLREHDKQEPSVSYHLDELLRGSRIYYEPPKPKAEPVLRTGLADKAYADTCRLLNTKP